MKEIKGKFEVKGIPIDTTSVIKELGLMHMKFDKVFFGDLSATSLVSMMGIINHDVGSGGYVALEKVTGELDSKKGTFFLQHSCSMSKGKDTQSIKVVPDSGTDELSGIKGEMKIDIVEGQHFYTFHYEV